MILLIDGEPFSPIHLIGHVHNLKTGRDDISRTPLGRIVKWRIHYDAFAREGFPDGRIGSLEVTK